MSEIRAYAASHLLGYVLSLKLELSALFGERDDIRALVFGALILFDIPFRVQLFENGGERSAVEH